MMPSDYRARLRIPVAGPVEMPLYSKSGLPLASGYLRVVIGGRGPYLEFERGQLAMESFAVPDDQAWRTDPQQRGRAYYIEHRSRDAANVKLYEQLRPVDYADYQPGLFYLSPFDLQDTEGNPIIDPIRKGPEPQPGLFD